MFSSFFFLFILSPCIVSFFFFNDTATTEIYTLSLHDALPIFSVAPVSTLFASVTITLVAPTPEFVVEPDSDRKSTRLNSSHQIISYAVFCLKKKKNEPGKLQDDGGHKSLGKPQTVYATDYELV